MYSAKPEVLNRGSPSPLWISCCYLATKCILFLLEELTPEQIAQPGPDGTTPLMQLFANAVKHEGYASDINKIILYFTLDKGKFLVKDVLEGSIEFGNLSIFRKCFNLGLSARDAEQMANLAIKSEQVEILRLIWKQFPSLQEGSRQLGAKAQTIAMGEFLGILKTETVQSQLLGMSSKFPKFNEDIEDAIQPLPRDIKVVSIEKDIKPLLKEKFCALACYGENPEAMPISDWKPTSCHKKHTR